MANSISTSKQAVTVAVSIAKAAPMLKTINTELSSELGAGDGVSADILIPDFGVVTEGAAIGDATVNVKSKSLTLKQYNTAASLLEVERATAIKDFQEQVADPRGAKLASKIQSIVYDNGFYAANNSVVATSANFVVASQAITKVKNSRSEGKRTAYISNDMLAQIVNSGDNKFNSPSIAADLYDGVVGSYIQTDFISGADAKIVYTGWVPGSAATVSSTMGSGTSSLTISDATIVNGTSVCKAGTVIKVADSNSVDLFGADLGVARSFVVQADVTASANGSITVNVGEVFNATSPAGLRNVSAMPASGKKVTSPLSANTGYTTGIVYTKEAICAGSKALKPLWGSESDSVATKLEGEVNITMSKYSNGDAGTQTARWDILFGAAGIYGQAICSIYTPVA